MKILKPVALTGYREYTKRTVAYAKFKAGSTWYQTKIESVTINSSGTVIIEVKIDASVTGKNTVTSVQLYNTNNELWAERTCSLKMDSVAEGFSFLFELTIEENDSD